ncbi:MAG: hypothetical protein IPN74_20135 [Haliscomenobacter sp.]|nr:hypothetical protein [Haliscomenobacter sp.]
MGSLKGLPGAEQRAQHLRSPAGQEATGEMLIADILDLRKLELGKWKSESKPLP